MLVLTRKHGEAVMVGGSDAFQRLIKITVVEINNGRVRLGIEADVDVPVNRSEVWKRTHGAARPSVDDTKPVA